MRRLNLLSLGAGVQSTTLFLMALHGEIDPMPDAAIFADTGAEPKAIYKHLEWIEDYNRNRIPLHYVSAGNIEESILGSLNGAGVGHVSQAPFYVKQSYSEGQSMPPASGGMLWRECTQGFKLEPIRRKVRELHLEAGRVPVVQWIGISYDEIQRAYKSSGVKYITNWYPLVEKRITREDCLKWLKHYNFPIPPKSACFFCPYTSNNRWREMKEKDPATFARAVEFDQKLRTGKLPGVTGDAYVHRSFIPLREVTFPHEQQLDLQLGFDNECEGICGV